MARNTLLDDVLELAELLKPTWPTISAAIPADHPRCEGEDGNEDGDGDAADADPAAGSGDASTDKTDHSDRPNWEAQARKHEREAKKARKEREELERKLREREDADKSEQEKALEKAREEARTEALAGAEKERRHDRLEVAVTRLAAKTFEDTEDALVNIERAIARGDVDEDDIFDSEGKVQTDSLKTALEELLERKPHLAAGHAGSGGGPGENDAGKGSGNGKGLEDMSLEEHLKAAQSRR